MHYDMRDTISVSHVVFAVISNTGERICGVAFWQIGSFFLLSAPKHKGFCGAWGYQLANISIG